MEKKIFFLMFMSKNIRSFERARARKRGHAQLHKYLHFWPLIKHIFTKNLLQIFWILKLFYTFTLDKQFFTHTKNPFLWYWKSFLTSLLYCWRFTSLNLFILSFTAIYAKLINVVKLIALIFLLRKKELKRFVLFSFSF